MKNKIKTDELKRLTRDFLVGVMSGVVAGFITWWLTK
jgi:hypothetical protein|nr:MAG TPA: cytochrome b-c1 complex subunit [Bacteriophage sp.]DAS85070.1 MAG TPA: cytochrome b-c1 complex subunit [Caudoviricetes sp.]